MFKKKRPAVLLIDGQCLLCNGITRFVVKRDKAKTFQFASLQSEAGQQFLRDGKLATGDLNTFVMIQNGKYFIKSSAALRVLRELDGLWPLLYVFIAVPQAWRNVFYDLIAQNRYRWFGKTDVCMLPTNELKDRFMENGVHAQQTEKTE
ncbi:putative DCC family thiol-disulfide oxidoreductase YuxK [Paenibacillus castaneae]|uniref:thiol-disulfide oxidoreductase DCC family protein n=1 Tax=Paenibacillus castaneae TaxID=474957 RepID=UPI000C9CF1EC|nr:DCC1-like thiol-disulfide oxidoreductase family protein [Paenibacillus castaneae]NIK76710.1 putative DCC family thiol-disulfide oxidoreductase YuxK [Paenibacillus castaneae]